MKNLITKDRFTGLFNLFVGFFIGWNAFDGYQNSDLANNQIKSLAVLASWMVLSGLYFLLRKKKV